MLIRDRAHRRAVWRTDRAMDTLGESGWCGQTLDSLNNQYGETPNVSLSVFARSVVPWTRRAHIWASIANGPRDELMATCSVAGMIGRKTISCGDYLLLNQSFCERRLEPALMYFSFPKRRFASWLYAAMIIDVLMQC